MMLGTTFTAFNFFLCKRVFDIPPLRGGKMHKALLKVPSKRGLMPQSRRTWTWGCELEAGCTLREQDRKWSSHISL